MNTSVGILGGGISGLTLGYALQQRGFNPTVYEQESTPGGAMKTFRGDGWLAEYGPNTLMLRSSRIQDLIDDLNLADEQVFANELANKRFIVKDGEPKPLPMSAKDFFTTDIFSTSAKLQLLKEPFVSRWTSDSDEDLAHFVERRIGREFLDYAINPFVAGVYAGDPSQLSVKHAFEKLYALEQDYGSLIMGTILGARKRRKRPDVPKTKARLFSFNHGVGTLPQALADRLGDHLKTNAAITGIRRTDNQWTVSYRQQDSSPQSARHDIIISTIPAYQLTKLNIETGKNLPVQPFDNIYYPPVSALTLGFEEAHIDHPLDGFGMLVPQVEPFKILGALFTSTLFPNRAPKDHVTITCFVGGARYPQLGNLSAGDIEQLCLRDLHTLLGVKGNPVFRHLAQWEKAIPQYEIGYGKYKQLMDEWEQSLDGFYFAGNYRTGIAVPDCILSALDLAERITK